MCSLREGDNGVVCASKAWAWYSRWPSHVRESMLQISMMTPLPALGSLNYCTTHSLNRVYG